VGVEPAGATEFLNSRTDEEAHVADVRIFQVDEHFFRVRVEDLAAPAEALREGRWVPVVLTTEEVVGLLNAHELTAPELEELDLPS
jgi:hypothetical protein